MGCVNNTTGWVIALAILGLIICPFCFIHTQKLERNYGDIQSGSGNETCTTSSYDIKQYGGHGYVHGNNVYISKLKCRVYAIDVCSKNEVKRELTSKKIVCQDALVDSFMATSPIGSEHLYYFFNRRPEKYYDPQKYQEFLDKYSKNPRVHTLVLAGFTCFFAIALIIAAIARYAYSLWNRSMPIRVSTVNRKAPEPKQPRPPIPGTTRFATYNSSEEDSEEENSEESLEENSEEESSEEESMSESNGNIPRL